MKKIEIKKMESINGGSGCGWVGIAAFIAYSNPLGFAIGHETGLNGAIADCWNN